MPMRSTPSTPALHGRYRWTLFKLVAVSLVEGMLLLLVVFSVSQAVWEDRLVDRVVVIAEVDPATESDHERALAIMSSVHRVLRPRLETLGPGGAVRPAPMASTDSHIQVPAGYCGSFSHVLARALQRAGIDAKLAQMLVGDVWGGHIVVAALIGGRWVALDPLYDVAFRGADGSLLGFEELQREWESVKDQCPPDYDHRYRYEGVRFTNWSRIPFGQSLFGGSEVSLRSHFLNLHWWYALVGLVGLAIGGLLLFRQWRAVSRQFGSGAAA
jgi:hypothetical protein